MKYLIFILLLFSCDKEVIKEDCWTCTTYEWTKGNADNKSVQNEFKTCDEGVMLIWHNKTIWKDPKMIWTECKQ